MNKIPELIRTVQDSQLIERLIRFAQQGDVKEEVHSFNTSYRARKVLGNLEVNFEDGINCQGDGYIIVKESNESKFFAHVDYSGVETIIRVITPPLNIDRPFAISTYIPGEWEKII